MKTVEVAVGVILRDGKIFISKRADDLHQGGKWEFPGGKREAGESMTDALKRELKEEINIDVISESQFMLIKHDYSDKSVVLDIRLVDGFTGQAKNQEGQIGQWVKIEDLDQFDFPAANNAIVERLQTTLTAKQ